MPPIDYTKASELLNQIAVRAERAFELGQPPSVGPGIEEAYNQILSSKTQSIREVLLGCILAKLVEPATDVRLAYAKFGSSAFNGRSLDERVINPFLRSSKIPCTRGPYLAVFRRSVRFDAHTGVGIRDQSAYEAFLGLLSVVEKADSEQLDRLAAYHLFRFLQLREESSIELYRVRRLSMEQLSQLVHDLLARPSGGRMPVYLAIAALKSFSSRYRLDWEIEHQEINVADRASESAGDVTVRHGNDIVLSAEITERHVDANRVVATFETKIAPGGIEDYLFLLTNTSELDSAKERAKVYFAQGHEILFVEIERWATTLLTMAGQRSRETFVAEMVALLQDDRVPLALKLTWNEAVATLSAAT